VLARLLERHPRGDVKEVLCRSLAGEAKAHPQSRMALWVSLGFLARVRAARL
jgi:hypothetical protein